VALTVKSGIIRILPINTKNELEKIKQEFGE
jgi:hypothetical protein